MIRIPMALLLLFCLPLSLEAKPRQAKRKEASASERPRELPPWPFEQAKREPGVKFRERVVSLNDGTVREWTFMVPSGSSARAVTDLSGNVTGIQPGSYGYVEVTGEGKVIAVTESKVCLVAAGREGRFWQHKKRLSEDNFNYLYGLELEAAISMEEPRAKKLKEAFKPAGQNRTTGPQVATAPTPRTWTDATGRYSMQATFAGVTAGKVKLRREDGQTVEFPMDKLSQEDQDWILEKR